MKLLLENGQEMVGTAAGSDRPVAGEVVFNTSMSGYIECMTDPSYAGQILVFTYPILGNYGVPSLSNESKILPRPFESRKIQASAIVVQSLVCDYSHHRASKSLAEFCSEQDIPILTGIDTRFLTQLLRESGTMQARLVPDDWSATRAKDQLDQPNFTDDIFFEVSGSDIQSYGSGAKSVLLIDIGVKENILRSLLERDLRVHRTPWHCDFEDRLKEADAIVIGNGPGNPQDLPQLIEKLRKIITMFDMPVLGICLGNQLLSLAAGAATYKLPYGHRSVNQPVQETGTQRCFITSQNHGYAVSDESLPEGWSPWFRNLNDGTNEGVRCYDRPFYGVQFHPEGCPGPDDTAFVFDEFVDHLRR